MIPLTKAKHFAEVENTSRAVWPVLEKAIQDETLKRGMETLSSHLDVLLIRRRGKNLLRPHVARLVLDLAGEEWINERNLRLLAAIEALNLSTYYANFAFDNKAGSQSIWIRNGQFLCSMLLLGIAESLIDSALSKDCIHCRDALFQLRDTNLSVYGGQHLDLHVLTYSEVHQYDKVEFFRKYFLRCSLLCGSTFRLCLLPIREGHFPQDVYESLESLLIHLGVGIQVINDVADFIPSSERNYADSYSDLLNGRLTISSYLLASNGVDLYSLQIAARDAIRGPEALKVFSEVLMPKVPIDEVREYVRARCWIPIRQQLRFLRRKLGARVDALTSFDFIPHLFFESRLLRCFDGLIHTSQ